MRELRICAAVLQIEVFLRLSSLGVGASFAAVISPFDHCQSKMSGNGHDFDFGQRTHMKGKPSSD